MTLRVPNGLRYPLVGGTRQRHFTGTNSKPRKVLENAQTPTSRVHALLGATHAFRSAEYSVRIHKRQACWYINLVITQD